MQIIMTSTAKGGEGKTTTALGLAMASCERGYKTLYIDLDPTTDGTTWLGMEPQDDEPCVVDIYSADGTPKKNPERDPLGWAMQLAQQSAWHKNLHVLPTHKSMETIELNTDPTMELRLKRSLVGADCDVVILDCPNRTGGPILRSAFLIADTIVYTVQDAPGLDGVFRAQDSLHEFLDEQRLRGINTDINEAGAIFCGYQATATPQVQTFVVDQLREADLLLTPLVPARTAVEKSRLSGHWLDAYGKGGRDVIDAYQEIGKKIIK